MSSLDPASVRAIFKAYDVRGTVPDQLDEELARRAGAAFVQVVAATTVVVGHDMRPSSPGLADAFGTGAAHGGSRRREHRAGLDRRALLRLGPPRPPRRDVHRQPQPRAVQRDQAVPRRRRRRSAWSPGSPRSATGSSPHLRRTRSGRAPSPRSTCSTSTSHTCSPWPPSRAVASRSSSTPATAWRAYTAPAVFDALGQRAGRGRADVLRARRHLPQPRGQPDRAGEPASTSRPGSWPRARTSASPSTATRTAASSWTSRAGPSRRPP